MKNKTLKMMTEKEMLSYINGIANFELFNEINNICLHKKTSIVPYPIYLKAIITSLIVLGYDPQWVNTVFKTALDKKYLKNI